MCNTATDLKLFHALEATEHANEEKSVLEAPKRRSYANMKVIAERHCLALAKQHCSF